MQHFKGLADLAPGTVADLLAHAFRIKEEERWPALAGKHIALIFDDASLRTRVSMDVALQRLKARASFFSINNDFWPIDYGGISQNGAAPSGAENVKELAGVLSQFYDCIGARISDEYDNFDSYIEDKKFTEFVKHSSVPVLNLNSSMEHPLQGLADMMTIRELDEENERDFVLTWAPNTKPRGWACAHSALIGAAHLGKNIIICHPDGYELGENYITNAKRLCANSNASLEICYSQTKALRNSPIVYAKSWCSRENFGKLGEVTADYERYSSWHLTLEKISKQTMILHPLPATRNVELLDEIMDHYSNLLLQQAKNKLYASAAALIYIFGHGNT
jgi:ornithine carbamoyltransferase